MATVSKSGKKKAKKPLDLWLKPGLAPKKPIVWEWLILGSLVLVIAFIRFKLLDTPLERDEGDYAYHGQMILDGVSLNDELIRKRFPVIFYLYAFILGIFGQTAKGVHTGLMLLNLGTIYMGFRLFRKILNPVLGMVSTIALAFLILTPLIDGFSANREHFVIASVLGGMLLMMHAQKTHRDLMYYLTGFLFGFAFVIKEPAVAFILFGGIWLIYQEWTQEKFTWKRLIRQTVFYGLGVFTPYLLVLLNFWILGALDDFFFRNYVLKRKYATTMSPSIGINTFISYMKSMFNHSPVLWLMAASGLAGAFIWKDLKKSGYLWAAFAGLSFLSIVPGWYFRSHYFVLIIPATALLIGIGTGFLGRLLSGKINGNSAKYAVIALLGAGIIWQVSSQSDYLFNSTPEEAVRINYGYNPFPESRVIGQFIKSNTLEDDRILVLGSEPQMYFYAHRKAAVEAIYMYDLMAENEYAKELQELTIEQAEKNTPRFIVLVNIPVSWQGKTNSEQQILTWAQTYLQNYRKVGVVDIIPNEQGGTQYIFDERAVNYQPRSSGHILIFMRA